MAANKKPRKAYRQRYAHHGSSLNTIRLCQRYTADEVRNQSIVGWDSFAKMVNGTADAEDVEAMYSLAHIVYFRSSFEDKKHFAPAVDLGKRAVDASTRTRNRYRETGRAGFDGEAMKTMRECLEFMDELLAESKIGLMMCALMLVEDMRKREAESCTT